MAIIYLLKDTMEQATNDLATEEDVPTVELYTTDELGDESLIESDVHESFQLLAHIEGPFAEVLPQSIVGVISVPGKHSEFSTRTVLHFFLSAKRLILVGDDGIGEELVTNTPELQLLRNMTPARVLLELLKTLVKNDLVTLSEFENRLSEVEEDIVERENHHTGREMPKMRRDLLKLDRFYQQLSDMAITLGKDESCILAPDDQRLFLLFSQQAERLYQRSQYLKEYSLQLREFFQTQIDIQQNKTIQWFTVVTTIFVPLTLITSWYGMNFSYMPELEWPYSYAVIIVICVILVILELIFFKHRKWL